MSEPRKQGPWLIHGDEIRFENPWIAIQEYDVTQPDGSPGSYGIVRYKNNAVGVLPVDEEGCTWLVGQHRFPFASYSWELPEGGGPKGEAPETTAHRELEEETGLKAATLTPIGHWHLSNSVSDEQAFAYLATGLSAGKTDPDPTEVLEIKRLPVPDVMDMIFSGEITDAFTVLMVQSAYIQAQRGMLPPNVARLLV